MHESGPVLHCLGKHWRGSTVMGLYYFVSEPYYLAVYILSGVQVRVLHIVSECPESIFLLLLSSTLNVEEGRRGTSLGDSVKSRTLSIKLFCSSMV